MLSAFGRQHTVKDWIAQEECKCGLKELRSRLARKIPAETAISTPGERKLIGVHKARNKWRASIRVGARVVKLGYFDTDTDAAIAFDYAAMLLKGDDATTNFDFTRIRNG
jgi:hypothetical protein